jgi:NADPH-dependent ferric siderophore reductase
VAGVTSRHPAASTRVRRQPPAFLEAVVARAERRAPYLMRVTLSGPALARFEPPLPAGSVRVLLPDAPGDPLVIPVWNGNAFFHVDGRRPVIRTLTPLRHDADAGELDIDVVLHGEGPLSQWAERGEHGSPAAVSGPGRGYTVDPGAATFVLAGDESAIPAIGQLVEALPSTADAIVIVEVAHPDARVDLGDRAGLDVRWVVRPAGSVPGAALVPAATAVAITPQTRVWAAGEAAAMQRIRRHLFDELGISRSVATVRGYWKRGSADAA